MELMRTWFEEVWNKGREDAIDAMAQPDVVVHGMEDPQGRPVRGVQDFKVFFRTFRKALSDLHIEVEHVITEGDFSAARFTVTGRHTGEGLALAPQGAKLNFNGMVIAKWKDGKIAESWNCVDFMKMVQQIQSASVQAS